MAKKVFIPTIGQKVVLKKGFEFTFVDERRNDDLKDMSLVYSRGGKQYFYLPENTKCKLDRIFIRKDAPQFDSITLTINKEDAPTKYLKDKIDGVERRKGWIRFFIKREDFNEAEFELSEDRNDIDIRFHWNRNVDPCGYRSHIPTAIVDGKFVKPEFSLSVETTTQYEKRHMPGRNILGFPTDDYMTIEKEKVLGCWIRDMRSGEYIECSTKNVEKNKTELRKKFRERIKEGYYELDEEENI